MLEGDRIGEVMQNAPRRVIGTDTESDLKRLCEKRELVRRGGAVELDDPEHIVARARRLADDAAAVTDLAAAERIIGSNELVHAHFLSRGVRAARAVGRIVEVSGRGEIVEAVGTASMISPHVLATNHHVLRTAEEATRHATEFGFEYDISGRVAATTLYRLDTALFVTDAELDITVVAVMPDAAGQAAGEVFGYNPLTASAGSLVIGDALNIVQHPGGGMKQVSFRENVLIDQDESYLVYETDTEPGSSGSPVFNDQWDLVAIHHRSLARVDTDGNALMKDSTRWQRGMPDDQVDWYANRGVKASVISEWLKAAKLSTKQRELIANDHGGSE